MAPRKKTKRNLLRRSRKERFLEEFRHYVYVYLGRLHSCCIPPAKRKHCSG